tara:strand:- start:668 stop:1072 length:405 start_codon:yes stop_codon:yes gene_type:complete
MTSLTLRNRNRTPSIFDTFFDDVFNIPSFRVSPTNTPQVRVDVNDGSYDVSIAAPGLPKNAVDVSVKENILTVAHDNKEETDNSYFCSSFKKSWTLPKDVNVEQITAKYNNGVFNVSVPRVQPVEPEVKKIKVK